MAALKFNKNMKNYHLAQTQKIQENATLYNLSYEESKTLKPKYEK